MKTFQIEDVTYTVPAYTVKEVKDQNGEADYWIVLEDGQFGGIAVRFDNIKMNDTDDTLMEYDLYTSEKVEDMTAMREVTNSILLNILNEQLLKPNKDESTPE